MTEISGRKIEFGSKSIFETDTTSLILNRDRDFTNLYLRANDTGYVIIDNGMGLDLDDKNIENVNLINTSETRAVTGNISGTLYVGNTTIDSEGLKFVTQVDIDGDGTIVAHDVSQIGTATAGYYNCDGAGICLDLDSEAASNPVINIQDVPSNKAVAIATSDKICLDTTTCSAYLQYDGTGLISSKEFNQNMALTEANGRKYNFGSKSALETDTTSLNLNRDLDFTDLYLRANHTGYVIIDYGIALQLGGGSTQMGMTVTDELGNEWCRKQWSDGVFNSTSGACS